MKLEVWNFPYQWYGSMHTLGMDVNT